VLRSSLRQPAQLIYVAGRLASKSAQDDKLIQFNAQATSIILDKALEGAITIRPHKRAERVASYLQDRKIEPGQQRQVIDLVDATPEPNCLAASARRKFRYVGGE